MRRRGLLLVLAAAVMLVATAGGLAAYDATLSGRIANGVRVAGVHVGGLTRGAAELRVRRELVTRLQRPLRVTYGSSVFVLDPRAAGVHVDVGGMVQQALNRSRSTDIFSRTYREVTGGDLRTNVLLRMVYSRQAVSALIRRIELKVNTPAVDAQVLPSALALQTTPAKPGVAVEARLLRRMIAAQLIRPGAPHVIRVPTRVVEPAVTIAGLAARYPYYITISRPSFRLLLWEHMRLAKTYTIAVGRAGLETPAGLYAINDKQVNPSWHVPNSPWAGNLAGRVIPPGPADPIKARWMGIANGAGIHGTDQIGSLGTAASHGCIRMAIPDVIELFSIVPLHTPVYIG